jgi:phosphatidylserine/phosphatidylglycerophosphate/cardiolipin synthase-like enzyme
VFNLENTAGTPIYVHAKICIIDDTWFTCGSDNFNRRSWTTDSELTCAVIDTTAGEQEAPDADTGPGASRPDQRPLAHRVRLQLWAEHLGLDQSDRLTPAQWTCAAPHHRTGDAPSASLGESGKPLSGGPGRPPPEDARHY